MLKLEITCYLKKIEKYLHIKRKKNTKIYFHFFFTSKRPCFLATFSNFGRLSTLSIPSLFYSQTGISPFTL